VAKNLVIVESPTKAKTLERYLGRDYSVQASMGHVRDLPKSKLGVATDDGFEPEYVVPDEKKKTVSALQSERSGLPPTSTGRARPSRFTWPRC
jgi:DNA topoisomerase-1